MPRRNRTSDRYDSGRRRQRDKDVLHDQRDGHRARDFRCVGCRLEVSLDAPGSGHRNHCPNCLASLHVDARIPGDRASPCRGRMTALTVSARPDGEWLIVHECLSCGELSTNRVAGDDNVLVLMRLAVRPLRNTGQAAHRTLLML
ncbi:MULTISPECIES: RNHCP domain-containing protein [unclassified Streptomyces]|uniref:RNHCP domain-containing protein n=1 Tax=unclassified Streptomyces TaxID=2593676 RepID=UPI00278C17C6|nr:MULTISPECIES: RNHCP domain-containing protein [unclassified Streptomyces]